MNLSKKNTLRIILILFSVILFYTVLQNTALVSGWLSSLGQVLSPIFIGIGFAFVINLPLRLFENKVFRGLNKRCTGIWPKIRRAVCLVLSVVLLLGIITLIIGLILPQVKDTAVSVIDTLPKQAENFLASAKKWVEELNLPVDFTKIFEEIDWSSISNSLMSGITDTGSSVIGSTIDFTSGLVGGVFNFVVGFILSLYILASKEKLARHVKRLIRAVLPVKACEKVLHIFRLSREVFTGFVTGQLTEAVLMGFWCYLGMTIFDMPYAVMISAVISVTALIPVFGALIGTSFGALMILFVNPLQAVGFVVYIVIVQQLDNGFIYPRIVGNSVGLPGIWVLCSVTVGGSLFGAAGMLLSVPVCAVIYCLIKEYVVKRETAAVAVAGQASQTDPAPQVDFTSRVESASYVSYASQTPCAPQAPKVPEAPVDIGGKFTAGVLTAFIEKVSAILALLFAGFAIVIGNLDVYVYYNEYYGKFSAHGYLATEPTCAALAVIFGLGALGLAVFGFVQTLTKRMDAKAVFGAICRLVGCTAITIFAIVLCTIVY